ncbi:pyrroloquinoline quinone biosynthesis peptide chaperone PqqD [Acidovorax sp. 210-6]|jgi:pyrroloquinoline quinone biosynthesis protein D|uniref:pyrroloquinoline quinone biosynthesis peptide chaperone PqqD n=1 Tax=Acidovorax sp. 210-6 TaxID=2699468 RepID=UPI001389E800|nr:pyrroloquinoline quinone biosynthesis peptide chaperone PqqD [Acidovorax sp. 210-6]NCU66900.1 pyrroloquinoline quinone biosynthesis peptide chaperone PqqD [Acidovorax sp. 210-6]
MAELPSLTPQERPRLAGHFRLQWEEAQKAWVLLYPEGMVKLNASAGEIMRRIDGCKTVGEIVAELEHAFATAGLAQDVHDFLVIAQQQGWIKT